MSIAFGSFALATKRFAPRRRRVVAQSQDRGTWWLAVCRLPRPDGTPAPVSRKLLDVLGYLRARFVEIEQLEQFVPKRKRDKKAPARPSPIALDWYSLRMPSECFRRERVKDTLRRQCSVIGPYGPGAGSSDDCPYGTRGRVFFGAGSGEAKPSANPAALRRAAFREVSRGGNRPLMVALLNMRHSDVAALEAVLWEDICADFPTVATWDRHGQKEVFPTPQDWPLSDSLWQRACAKWYGLPYVWQSLEGAMAQAEMDVQSAPTALATARFELLQKRLEILSKWITVHIDPNWRETVKADEAMIDASYGPRGAPSTEESLSPAERFRQQSLADTFRPIKGESAPLTPDKFIERFRKTEARLALLSRMDGKRLAPCLFPHMP